MEARFSNNASYFCGEVKKIVLIDGENMLLNKKWHNWWNYRIISGQAFRPPCLSTWVQDVWDGLILGW